MAVEKLKYGEAIKIPDSLSVQRHIVKDDPVCDACGVPMNWEDYQAHDCPAYLNSEHRNPLAHKMAKAKWMTPRGTVVARGMSLTAEQIETARKEQGLWSYLRSLFRPRLH